VTGRGPSFFFLTQKHFFLNLFLISIFSAVKFGRMSKKQREKVEDEVRYHRAQMKAQQAETSPDSSVFDNQQPSSSDQLAPYTGG
jgi:hypothetical protein